MFDLNKLNPNRNAVLHYHQVHGMTSLRYNNENPVGGSAPATSTPAMASAASASVHYVGGVPPLQPFTPGFYTMPQHPSSIIPPGGYYSLPPAQNPHLSATFAPVTSSEQYYPPHPPAATYQFCSPSGAVTTGVPYLTPSAPGYPSLPTCTGPSSILSQPYSSAHPASGTWSGGNSQPTSHESSLKGAPYPGYAGGGGSQMLPYVVSPPLMTSHASQPYGSQYVPPPYPMEAPYQQLAGPHAYSPGGLQAGPQLTAQYASSPYGPGQQQYSAAFMSQPVRNAYAGGSQEPPLRLVRQAAGQLDIAYQSQPQSCYVPSNEEPQPRLVRQLARQVSDDGGQ